MGLSDAASHNVNILPDRSINSATPPRVDLWEIGTTEARLYISAFISEVD